MGEADVPVTAEAEPVADAAAKDPPADSPDGGPANDGAPAEVGDAGAAEPAEGGAAADGVAETEAGDQPAPAEEQEEELAPLPEGAEFKEVTPTPIFLAGASQEIFECVQDKDVTAAKPEKLIPIKKIKDDMIARAAVSDFSVVKEEMKKYKGEEVLLVMDPDFKYGENFFLFTTAEDKDQYLLNALIKAHEAAAANKGKKKKKTAEGADAVDDESEEEEEEEEEEVTARRPSHWVSMGSEAEVDAGIWQFTRPPINFLISRRRRYFGAPVELADRTEPVVEVEEGRDAPEGPPPRVDAIEWRTVEVEEDDPTPVSRRQMDRGSQAVAETVVAAAQTTWRPKRNRAIQYEALTKSSSAGPDADGIAPLDSRLSAAKLKEAREAAVAEAARVAAEQESKLAEFLRTVYPTVQAALDENEYLGLFSDDFGLLLEETKEPVLLSQEQSTLQEHQSFKYVDTPFDDAVSCVAWHPTLPDIFAVALTRRDTFSQRVEHTLKGTPGMVAVWNMLSPIEPRLLLKAPEEILWVEFCPTCPSLVAGGCVNGQLIVWDISKTLMAALSEKMTSSNDGNDMFNDSDRQVPVVQHVLSSSIEHSHGSAVTQIMWVPAGLDLSKSGRPQPQPEGTKPECVQLLTLAADTTMLLWDLRPDKMKFSLANLKMLDLVWRPLFKIFIAQLPDETADNGGVRFVARPLSKKVVEGEEDDAMQTMVFIGTERGNLLYMDWRAKELDNGKLGVQEVERGMMTHAGPVSALRRSPFIEDLVLSVGGMGITVWKEGLWAGPILTASTAGQVRATAAEWSPTRPGVFFVGKADGTVDVWDLMDTTYVPALVVNICSPVAVCQFEAQRCNAKVSKPYVAVGDDNGVVHVMEVPPGYATAGANEADRLHTFVEAEAHRLEYVAKRMEHRAAQKKKGGTTTVDDGGEAAGADGEADPEAVAEAKLRVEVDEMLGQYRDQEKAFLESVGLYVPEPEQEPDD